MSEDKDAFIRASRVPRNLAPQEKYPWKIGRYSLPKIRRFEIKPSFDPGQYLKQKARLGPFKNYVTLTKWTDATIHQMHGDVVMEDSYAELETHWPIWRDAEGTVLVTGLGLGCVVRGLLNSPKVTHIDCVEIDPWIFQTIGKEFEGNSKVSLHLGDALRFKKRGRWDYAWHDIYTENGNGLPLAKLHTDLMFRVFGDKAKRQGAWNFPKEVSAKYGLIF